MKVVAPPQGAHLASPTGAVFVLKPGETRDIPPYLEKLAYEKGCKPANDVPAPPTQDDRELIKQAVADMVAEGNPDHFTANGRPKIALVRARSGADASIAQVNEVFDEVMRDHDGP